MDWVVIDDNVTLDLWLLIVMIILVTSGTV